MILFKKIKNYFQRYHNENVETMKREEELVGIVEKLRNIDIFSKNIVNKDEIKVDVNTKKINIINKINIEKMNTFQLQNTYKFIKKSITDAENKRNLEQLDELKKLKNKIKQKLINENDHMDLNSIRNNLILGNIEKIDAYEHVLLDLYNDIEQNDKNRIKSYDYELQQKRIHILALLKLISKIKKSNTKQYVKKIA